MAVGCWLHLSAVAMIYAITFALSLIKRNVGLGTALELVIDALVSMSSLPQLYYISGGGKYTRPSEEKLYICTQVYRQTP